MWVSCYCSKATKTSLGQNIFPNGKRGGRGKTFPLTLSLSGGEGEKFKERLSCSRAETLYTVGIKMQEASTYVTMPSCALDLFAGHVNRSLKDLSGA